MGGEKEDLSQEVIAKDSESGCRWEQATREAYKKSRVCGLFSIPLRLSYSHI
jgi:hypothetical protein